MAAKKESKEKESKRHERTESAKDRMREYGTKKAPVRKSKAKKK